MNVHREPVGRNSTCWSPLKVVISLFPTAPDYTDPATVRTGLSASVPALHEVLPELTNAGARLEHVYDY